MKKALSIAIVLVLMFVMCIPSFATKLTTEVPYEHTVTINYNEGGTVLLDGRVCPNGAQVKVNRFGEIDLSTILKNGYHLEKVTVNGVDVTSYYKDGNVKITNITDDVYVNFIFEKCSEDPDDNCENISMTGTVYLGDKELPGAEMSFDFGSVVASTNKDGKYYVEQISEGRHIVTISKNGEVLAHITFVIEFADVDEVTLRTAVDGTQVVMVPYGTDLVYLDFYIIDSDGDGIPDQNPDITDPDRPEDDPDDDNDGVSDKDDPDDDNDGIPDEIDPDDDNDGILDEDDPNHPDHDTDDDGIPDRVDPDDDNDGIPDKDDTDDDGDGIPDEDDPDSPDRDTDGDGIPDREDKDDDNDGLPDGEQDWDDNDGDGILDDEDPDDDNDGIPDDKDPDDDGDGYHDDYDGSEEGDLDNDGGIIDVDKPGQIIPDVDIPNTSADRHIRNPLFFIFLFGFMFFFIIILFFKRKKDEDEEEIVEVIE